ncbi:hypothetical protein Bca101_030414 [Brassica carinata]
MRLYLLSASGPEKIIREQRVKTSLADIGNDPVAQKSFLSLEAIPSVTSEVDKGKGHVFDFEKQDNINIYPQVPGYHTKLLASAIQAGGIRRGSFVPQYYRSEGSANNSFDDMMAYSYFSSVNAAKAGEAGSSGTAVGFKQEEDLPETKDKSLIRILCFSNASQKKAQIIKERQRSKLEEFLWLSGSLVRRSQWRDCLNFYEPYELELPRLGTVSRIGDSTSQGN